MKRAGYILLVFLLAGNLSGCGKENTGEMLTAVETTVSETIKESQAVEEIETENSGETDSVYQASIEEVIALLNKSDEEAAGLLGGGEENWTQDKSFYIGRNYEIELDGVSYPVHTSCDEDKIINSVSMWIANGDRTVSQEEVDQWLQKLETVIGFEPVYDGTTSEAGSKNWDWRKDGTQISLRWSGDILAINVNAIKGELK